MTLLRAFTNQSKRKQWVKAKAAVFESQERACSRCREGGRAEGEAERWLEEQAGVRGMGGNDTGLWQGGAFALQQAGGHRGWKVEGQCAHWVYNFCAS